MRTKVQDRRLKKLIAFLRELPRGKFYFGDDVKESKSNGHTCATVACAIGWTPAIFPRVLKWVWYGDYNEKYFWHYSFKGERYSFADISDKLLGCPHHLFIPQEQQCVHAELEDLSDDATPKQVARMLER